MIRGLRAVDQALQELEMDEDLEALKAYLGLRMDGIERILMVRIDNLVQDRERTSTFVLGEIAEIETRHRQLNDGVRAFEEKLLDRVAALERQQANLAGRLWMLGGALSAVVVLVNVALKAWEILRVVPK